MSLVSHTNVGKTTLARTLLRRDVGEVLDQAHVTEVSEGYTLIESDIAFRPVVSIRHAVLAEVVYPVNRLFNVIARLPHAAGTQSN